MNDFNTEMAEAIELAVVTDAPAIVPVEGEVVAVVTEEGEVAQPEDIAV